MESRNTPAPAWQKNYPEVYEKGPRTFTIAHQYPEINFLVMGCEGVDCKGRTATADLMNKLCETNRVDFTIGTGDHFYKNGLYSKNDDRFKNEFVDVYATPAKAGLENIPFFNVLGNHDKNLHSITKFINDKIPIFSTGDEVGINQVAYTYTQENAKCYEKENLTLAELPKWNMPYFFYSVIIGDVEFFYLDSNAYVRDYFATENNEAKSNQATWLAEAMIKCKQAGRTPICIQHHGLVSKGKRVANGDSHHYLRDFKQDNEDMSELDNAATKLGIPLEEKYYYNQLLRKTFEKQGIEFAAVLSAHDHHLAVTKINNTVQVTSGGAGGHLQAQEDFSDPENNLGLLKENGCFHLSMKTKKPQEIKIEMHSTVKERYTGKHKQLFFSSKSNESIRDQPLLTVNNNEIILDQKAVEFRKMIFDECNDYQRALDQAMKKNKTSKNNESLLQKFWGVFAANLYKQTDITALHEILYCINKKDADNFNTLKFNISRIINNLETKEENKKNNLLYSKINAVIEKYKDQNIEFKI